MFPPRYHSVHLDNSEGILKNNSFHNFLLWDNLAQQQQKKKDVTFTVYILDDIKRKIIEGEVSFLVIHWVCFGYRLRINWLRTFRGKPTDNFILVWMHYAKIKRYMQVSFVSNNLSFVKGFSSHSKVFTRMETKPIPVKGCTFWLMLGTLSSEGFFSVPHQQWQAHSFIMVICEDPWHSHLCRAFGSGTVTTCF